MNSVMRTVCNNIIYLRKLHGKTQQEVAEYLGGMTRSNYAKLEVGAIFITVDRLYSLAKLFAVPMDVMVEIDLEEHFKENPAVQDNVAPYHLKTNARRQMGIQLTPHLLANSEVRKRLDALLDAIAAAEEATD
ncbi:MAG: helix-turn-helix domain-containing protein [Schleiferiaceae bacterium]|nr:helix-turn-helix domain-containing protein [Schleiferiaceae bacterium]